jgi:hypothetical protein
MARRYVLTGPKPPQGAKWCTACAMLWRGIATDWYKDLIKSYDADPDGATKPVAIIDMRQPPEGVEDTRMQLQPAVAHGIYQPLGPPPAGNGLLPLGADLCWTHMLGLTLRDTPGVLPSDPQQLAALEAQLPRLDRKPGRNLLS